MYINKGIKKQILELIKLRSESNYNIASVFLKTEQIPGDKQFKKWLSDFWKLLKEKVDVKKEDIAPSRVIDNIVAELKRKLKEEFPVPDVFLKDENQGASLVLEKGVIKMIPKTKPEPPKAVELPEIKPEEPAAPIVIPKEEFVAEHKELVKVLKEDKPEEVAKEAEKQEEELKDTLKKDKVLSDKTIDSYVTHLMRIKIGLGAKEEDWLDDTSKVISWIDNLKSINGKTLSASAIKTFYAAALWKSKEKPEIADIYRAKMKGLKATTDVTPAAPAPEPNVPPPPPAPEPEVSAPSKAIEKHSKSEIATLIREHLAKKGKRAALSHLTKEELLEAYKTLVV